MKPDRIGRSSAGAGRKWTAVRNGGPDGAASGAIEEAAGEGDHGHNAIAYLCKALECDPSALLKIRSVDQFGAACADAVDSAAQEVGTKNKTLIGEAEGAVQRFLIRESGEGEHSGNARVAARAKVLLGAFLRNKKDPENHRSATTSGTAPIPSAAEMYRRSQQYSMVNLLTWVEKEQQQQGVNVQFYVNHLDLPIDAVARELQLDLRPRERLREQARSFLDGELKSPKEPRATEAQADELARELRTFLALAQLAYADRPSNVASTADKGVITKQASEAPEVIEDLLNRAENTAGVLFSEEIRRRLAKAVADRIALSAKTLRTAQPGSAESAIPDETTSAPLHRDAAMPLRVATKLISREIEVHGRLDKEVATTLLDAEFEGRSVLPDSLAKFVRAELVGELRKAAAKGALPETNSETIDRVRQTLVKAVELNRSLEAIAGGRERLAKADEFSMKLGRERLLTAAREHPRDALLVPSHDEIQAFGLPLADAAKDEQRELGARAATARRAAAKALLRAGDQRRREALGQRAVEEARNGNRQSRLPQATRDLLAARFADDLSRIESLTAEQERRTELSKLERALIAAVDTSYAISRIQSDARDQSPDGSGIDGPAHRDQRDELTRRLITDAAFVATRTGREPVTEEDLSELVDAVSEDIGRLMRLKPGALGDSREQEADIRKTLASEILAFLYEGSANRRSVPA